MKTYGFTEEDLFTIAGVQVESTQQIIKESEEDFEDEEVLDDVESEETVDDGEEGEGEEELTIETVTANVKETWNSFEQSVNYEILIDHLSSKGDGHLADLVEELEKAIEKCEDALNMVLDAVDGEDDKTTETPDQDELDAEAEKEAEKDEELTESYKPAANLFHKMSKMYDRLESEVDRLEATKPLFDEVYPNTSEYKMISESLDNTLDELGNFLPGLEMEMEDEA